jgi:hypothetical protein
VGGLGELVDGRLDVAGGGRMESRVGQRLAEPDLAVAVEVRRDALGRRE